MELVIIREWGGQKREDVKETLSPQSIQHGEEEEVNLPGAELCPGMGLCLPMAGEDICSHSTRLSCKPMSPSQ